MIEATTLINMGDFMKQGATIFAKKDCILFLCSMKCFFLHQKKKKRKEKEGTTIFAEVVLLYGFKLHNDSSQP